jgi:hypothetical protein
MSSIPFGGLPRLPALGVKGLYHFLKRRPGDNCAHRVQKLFPCLVLFPLRVFHTGECFLFVHAFTVSQYKYLISVALNKGKIKKPARYASFSLLIDSGRPPARAWDVPKP